MDPQMEGGRAGLQIDHSLKGFLPLIPYSNSRADIFTDLSQCQAPPIPISITTIVIRAIFSKKEACPFD
jgi:hypothetical protein